MVHDNSAGVVDYGEDHLEAELSLDGHRQRGERRHVLHEILEGNLFNSQGGQLTRRTARSSLFRSEGSFSRHSLTESRRSMKLSREGHDPSSSSSSESTPSPPSSSPSVVVEEAVLKGDGNRKKRRDSPPDSEFSNGRAGHAAH